MSDQNGSKDVRELLAELTIKQDRTQEQLDQLTSEVNRVLARSAVLDDVLLELRDSHEQHQQNFEESQRSTNAAIDQLTAILMRLTEGN